MVEVLHLWTFQKLPGEQDYRLISLVEFYMAKKPAKIMNHYNSEQLLRQHLYVKVSAEIPTQSEAICLCILVRFTTYHFVFTKLGHIQVALRKSINIGE